MKRVEVETWRREESPERLRDALRRGGVLVIPTESSYGFAVDPRSVHGVASIYRLKGREAGKALPVVAASVTQMQLLGVDPAAPLVAAAARFWPAPLTIVVPCRPGLPAAAGDSTIAVRVPAHDGLREVLLALGHPLTATSANPSGVAPFTDPRRLGRWLAGEDVIVVDFGILPGGPPSTLIAASEGIARVLRVGSFPPDDLLRLVAAPPTIAPGRPAAGWVGELR